MKNLTIDQAQELRKKGMCMVTNLKIDKVLFVGTKEDAEKFEFSRRKKVKGSEMTTSTVKVFYPLIKHKVTKQEILDALASPSCYSL